MKPEIAPNPAYPTKHTGTALVIGAAPTALVDMAVALEGLHPERPFAIAVNGMVGRVPCRAMVTCHPDSLGLYLRNGQEPPTVHYYPSDQRNPPPSFRGVDYVWSGIPAGSGSSSLCAVFVAKALGFERVILCGVPLTKTGYVDKYPGMAYSEFNNLPEGRLMNGTIRQRHDTWINYQKAGLLDGVTSFSGFTKDLLGAPEFNKEAA